MEGELEFKGLVSSGRLPREVEQAISNGVRFHEGKRVVVTVREEAKLSSENQRRYYFKVIVEAFQRHFKSLGQPFSKDNMHDAMMRGIGGFGKPFINPFTGQEEQGRISYMKLSTSAVEAYHHLCRMKAAELGFDVPEPNEVPFD